MKYENMSEANKMLYESYKETINLYEAFVKNDKAIIKMATDTTQRMYWQEELKRDTNKLITAKNRLKRLEKSK